MNAFDASIEAARRGPDTNDAANTGSVPNRDSPPNRDSGPNTDDAASNAVDSPPAIFVFFQTEPYLSYR